MSSDQERNWHNEPQLCPTGFCPACGEPGYSEERCPFCSQQLIYAEHLMMVCPECKALYHSDEWDRKSRWGHNPTGYINILDAKHAHHFEYRCPGCGAKSFRRLIRPANYTELTRYVMGLRAERNRHKAAYDGLNIEMQRLLLKIKMGEKTVKVD